jgi:broad specificity phosphatase PhoE
MTVLIAVRHGESAANADAAALDDCPDADIPLTARGREQCVRLGRELAALDPAEPIGRVLCSPFARCRETICIVTDEFARAGRALPAVEYDARLRDRDAAGEESADGVAARVGEVLEALGGPGAVLLVAHDAVVLALRQLVEGRPAEGPVAHGSITRLFCR